MRDLEATPLRRAIESAGFVMTARHPETAVFVVADDWTIGGALSDDGGVFTVSIQTGPRDFSYVGRWENPALFRVEWRGAVGRAKNLHPERPAAVLSL